MPFDPEIHKINLAIGADEFSCSSFERPKVLQTRCHITNGDHRGPCLELASPKGSWYKPTLQEIAMTYGFELLYEKDKDWEHHCTMVAQGIAAQINSQSDAKRVYARLIRQGEIIDAAVKEKRN